MTCDPDEKNTHVQRQNALFQIKQKVSTIFSYGDKKYKAKTGNDLCDPIWPLINLRSTTAI